MSAERGGGREVAYRIFAAEYDDASLSHTESDEDRAPNYVITPTGARVNRLFAVGTLTEVTQVNDEMVRARIVDPTGAFVVYAGQYQPDQLAFLERVDPPAFVALTGKARTFEPEDGDRVYTSVRPESLAIVDGDTRDRWVVDTAERTLDRIRTYAAAAELDVLGADLEAALVEAGVDSGLAIGIPLAQDHYGTTPAYLAGLRDLALDAAAVVAGELDEVDRLDLTPDATGGDVVTFADLTGGLDAELVDALQAVTDAATSPPADTLDETVTEPEMADTTGSAADPADASVTETEPTVDEEGGSELSDTAATKTQPVVEEELEDDERGDDGTFETADESATEDGDVESIDGDEILSTEDGDGMTESDDGMTESDDETTEGDVGASIGDDDDELGDFESGELGSGMYEMDDEERAEIEAEFGTEFATGTEVDDPGEADIDIPDPEDLESKDETTSEPEEDPVETEPEEDQEDVDDEPPEEDAEPASTDLEDVDLQEYVVETMADLDDGSGADRIEVIETVVEDTGASTDDVEDAIQDALMGGQCYEPEDDTLKAI